MTLVTILGWVISRRLVLISGAVMATWAPVDLDLGPGAWVIPLFTQGWEACRIPQHGAQHGHTIHVPEN